MKRDFRVSVVVPVYNAEPFLRRAVEAALSQPETGEVILVEDNSPDGSLALCEKLRKEDRRVRLIRHADGRNHGAAMTRNLGIRSATCSYVAFADADNFYLAERFAGDGEILSADSTIDGVYNAQGIHYYSESARNAFRDSGLSGGEFLSTSGHVPPDDFWRVMLGAHREVRVIGGLGIDAITLRRSVFERTGYFDPSLRLMQDVHFFVRMAVTSRMAAGRLDQPVAVRGVHDQMRSTDPELMAAYRKACWTSLRKWIAVHVSDPAIRLAFDESFFRRSAGWSSQTRQRMEFIKLVARHPHLILDTYGTFDLGLLDSFGRNFLTSHAVSFKAKVLRHYSTRSSST